ncbi:MAG: hypothetical protein AAGA66_01250 [Bacteroidota bacterium]
MNESDASPDDEEQLRFENELKKLKLIAESGAQIGGITQRQLPPEVESQWLDTIMAFDKAAQEKKMTTVRKVVGDVELPKPENLSDKNLPLVINATLDLFEKRGISLTVLHEEDVSDRELYQFIVDEFLDTEMNDITIAGMVSCFNYEDFHPNHKEDIKWAAREFLEMLSSKSFQMMNSTLASKIECEGNVLSCPNFIEKLKAFTLDKELIIHSIAPELPKIGDDLATLKIRLDYALSVSDSDMHSFVEDIDMELVTEHGFWSISRVLWPGFDLN